MGQKPKLDASSCSRFLVSPRNREIGGRSGWAAPGFVELRQEPLKSKYLPSGLCLAVSNGGFGKSLNGAGNGDGVIIVDHGSRRKETNLVLSEFVDMFRGKTKYPIVEPAHMELAEPSIKDAFNSCVEQGARRLIVSPFFLFAGRHWHQDVVNDRINHCLSHVTGEKDECFVCAGTGKCKVYYTSN